MTDHPNNLSNHPDDEEGASADLLSHVLGQLRLAGDKVRSSTFAANQVVELNPKLAHVVAVREGTITLDVKGVETVQVRAGDLLLLPHGPGDARLATIDGCGHMAPVEAPDELCALMRDWLTV